MTDVRSQLAEAQRRQNVMRLVVANPLPVRVSYGLQERKEERGECLAAPPTAQQPPTQQKAYWDAVSRVRRQYHHNHPNVHGF